MDNCMTVMTTSDQGTSMLWKTSGLNLIPDQNLYDSLQKVYRGQRKGQGQLKQVMTQIAIWMIVKVMYHLRQRDTFSS